MRNNLMLVSLFVILSAACAQQPAEEHGAGHSPLHDLGLLWVKHAAEYEALTRQAYRAATDALPRFIADTSWSAVPEQGDAEALPPAVILDVDETVVSNVDFQLTFERPFENWKLDTWTKGVDATPVAGVKEFVEAARAQGVEVFFVTNRPCEPIAGHVSSCPQRETTIHDIREVGIPVTADRVFLSEERGWTREKLTRRLHIANTHRVIMLIGDDLGDFIACVRSSPNPPCTEAATSKSRRAAVEKYADYWGNGWYVLPNPMHGSWTSAK
jgi:acid phosphatase